MLRDLVMFNVLGLLAAGIGCWRWQPEDRCGHCNVFVADCYCEGW